MTGPTAGAAGPDRLAALQRIGLSWQPSGQAALRGPLLRLAEDCDRAFVCLASLWDAEEERHPASLPAARLQQAGYLRSFPHQATFVARLSPEEPNVDAFLDGPVIDEDGRVALSALSPVTEVLTPAACYHLYNGHQGEALDRPLYLTTRNTCFRQETHHVPLRRLSSFTMREIVCLGTVAETVTFLERARAALDLFFGLLDLDLEWLAATDPFFRPEDNPRHLLQRVQPVKHEATYGGDLAIASVNRHHDHFGSGFGLTRDGRAADSCCVAFGIERWLWAISDRHGLDPASWPALEDAAATVRAKLRGGTA
ncbi:hypothetical protein QMK19_34880 [Streptomyces sp. H10-C2]|uniref:hypothetical protein n=1 Tax=unclassified Streptomyces TaxID=2593676 RepID=UPI0024BA05C9|nr:MULTISPECIES: hypothetical protein [unclassified Streptomyces]MDJ0345780.1 hypothetical protein [Streptomyces sp. PH10-H1]MDJ0374670.1 hypothetical protein [Streptomyces sp. H10-C2]